MFRRLRSNIMESHYVCHEATPSQILDFVEFWVCAHSCFNTIHGIPTSELLKVRDGFTKNRMLDCAMFLLRRFIPERVPLNDFVFARALRLQSYCLWALGHFKMGSEYALLALKRLKSSISSELASIDLLRYHMEMRECLSKYAICNRDGQLKKYVYV